MFLRLARSVFRVDQCLKINRLQFPRFITHAVESPATVVPSSNASAIPSAADVASSMKLSVLKRVPRKKRLSDTSKKSDEHEQYFTISALATADWYDLDRLKQRFVSSSSPFQIVPIAEVIKNVLCVQIPSQRSESTTESEAFIFEDGAVVFWNVQKEHEKLILHEIDEVSDNRYPVNLISNEKEVINFTEVYTSSTITQDTIRLNRQLDNEQLLDKYTFSNALALSVKLGIWETLLDDEVEFVADLANRLKQGKHIKIEHGLMQRKSGELYSLKHAVNLSHDFLDTPDFYWSNSRLENLYKKVFNYFTIAKRTKVLNERLNFSLELVSVIEASLNEKKHVRLEWIIIILICAEVFFNIIDHVDFLSPKPASDKESR